jgi:hypothetical protein
MMNHTSFIINMTVVCCTILSATSVNGQSCNPLEIDKVFASDGAEWDSFGSSVSTSENVAVIGASWNTDNGLGSGSAYIFRFDPLIPGWIEEAKLLPNDGGPGDQFGMCVDISSNVAVIGAPWDDDAGSRSGSAYVFRYVNGRGWLQQAKLVAADGERNDKFGISVAVDGNVIVIGADYDYHDNVNSGSAYVFRYDPGSRTWNEETKLLGSDRKSGDAFGSSVAISNNVIVVGATGAEYRGSDNSGCAYVYRYDVGLGEWIEESKIGSADGTNGDSFGEAVAIHGDIIVAGADGDDDMGPNSGTAFVFRKYPGGTSWAQEAKLVASDGANSDDFGVTVALHDDVVLVGGPYHDDPTQNNTGAVYLYRYDPVTGDWPEQLKIQASDRMEYDVFGRSVALSGNSVIVGASGADTMGDGAGAAYMFDLNCATLAVQPIPLLAGQNARVSIKHAIPNEPAYLAYSTTGAGSTPVPYLNVTLDLAQPQQAGNSKRTDSFGAASWTLPIPPNAAGLDIWFQGAQDGRVTNVVATTIQ